MDKFFAHILVVDDDEGIRSLVKKFLNEKKYLVTTACNAEDASEKIKIIKFDLMGLNISQVFNPTFCRRCRSSGSLTYAPPSSATISY